MIDKPSWNSNPNRTWEVTLTNTGNKDVTVNAVYAIAYGLTNISTDWEMLSEPTVIALPRNTPVVHTFTAKAQLISRFFLSLLI